MKEWSKHPLTSFFSEIYIRQSETGFQKIAVGGQKFWMLKRGDLVKMNSRPLVENISIWTIEIVLNDIKKLTCSVFHVLVCHKASIVLWKYPIPPNRSWYSYAYNPWFKNISIIINWFIAIVTVNTCLADCGQFR